MTVARDIVKALKGRWHGGYGSARCPAHNDRSPSLSLCDSHDGRILVRCHAGCEQDRVIDALRGLGLWANRSAPTDLTKPEFSRRHENDQDDARRTIRALTIWGEGKPIAGTPALTYLGRRGIDVQQLPGNMTHALRWHPQCPWEAGKHGAMIALMTDAMSGEPRAIHRTAITANGEKIGRKMLGPTKGCVIRLWPDEEVLDGLVIGEGIETALAAATRIEHAVTLLQPAWACATAGLLATFPVLSGIEALTILVDRDESGTGEKAATECAARWNAAGREVIRLTPIQVGDFNDIVGRPNAA